MSGHLQAAGRGQHRLSLWNGKTLGKALGPEIQSMIGTHLLHLSDQIPNVSMSVYLLEKGHLLLLASVDNGEPPRYAPAVSFSEVKVLFEEGNKNQAQIIQKCFLQGSTLRQGVAIPLLSKNEIKGLIVTLPTEAALASSWSLKNSNPTLRSITGLMSTIDQLLREQRRSRRLRLINKICQNIDTFIAEEKLYGRIVNLIQKSFGYDHAAIYLLDRDASVLHLETFAGKYRGKIPENQSISLDQGIVGWVASHGKTLLSNDARQNPFFLNLTPESIPTEAELCVPIRIENEVVGVLNIEHSELLYFDDDDINTVELLADRIGVAIKNSQTFANLHKGHNLLEEIVSSVGHGLMMVDRNFRVHWINKTLVKWGFEGMVGNECYRFLSQNEAACMNCPTRRTFETGRVQRETLKSRGGRYYAVTSAPLKDASGSVTRVLEMVEDITNSVKAEDELEYLKRELERSQQLASISELAANIVHEVRNPVNAMSQAIELLESDLRLTGEQRQLMNVVKEECVRLNDNLGTYLSLAHKQRDFGRADLKELITSVLELIKVDRTIVGRVKFSVDLPSGLPALRLDSNAIRQVFWNLLSNAAESIVGEGSVKVRGELADSMLYVNIEDSGQGIDEERLRKIFEPFYSTKGHGTGLGLAIVKRIIDDHEWKINVESVVGQGSRFTIAVPLT